jgi:TetR/AcrR family transcriptional regulator, transcriptional repressor for nem operon
MSNLFFDVQDAMPRVSRAQAQRNDAAIRRAAAALLRQQGLKVSVAQVMAAAGLTAGGFYGHFGSKDQLLASGCTTAFEESAQRWEQRAAAAPDAAPAALIDAYLDAQGPVLHGCPIASLATDVAREPAELPVRAAFAAGLERLLGILAGKQGGPAGAARETALLQLSAMVGAVTLARATRGSALSQDLLKGVRQGLHPPVRKRRPARRARSGRERGR